MLPRAEAIFLLKDNCFGLTKDLKLGITRVSFGSYLMAHENKQGFTLTQYCTKDSIVPDCVVFSLAQLCIGLVNTNMNF